MNIIFMGTPDFSVESLKHLVDANIPITAVYTRPDRPKNRGMQMMPTPVKEYALTKNIPIYQPEKLNDTSAEDELESLKPDLIITSAYSQFLSKRVITMPKYGCINVHPSLLPKYRGPSPIESCVMNGDEQTGVSIIFTVEAMDAGDVILQKPIQILEDETAEDLEKRLAVLGGELLVEAVRLVEHNQVNATKQDEGNVVITHYITKDLSPMDFSLHATKLHNLVRALIPWPCASTDLLGKRCKVFRTKIGPSTDKAPGTLISASKAGILVACGENSSLYLLELQEDGGKRMTAEAYLAGHKLSL